MAENPNPTIHTKLEETPAYEAYLKKRKEEDPEGTDEFDALEGKSKINVFSKKEIIFSIINRKI